MYTLYYLPDACSLATQVVLHELGQNVDIIDKQKVENFAEINPVGSVPVLVDNGKIRREGAAILLHLLDTHPNDMLPLSGRARELAIQNILFANATMHPAYSRLFFIAQHITDDESQLAAFKAASELVTELWQVVEQQLSHHTFLGGDHPSAADILLAVYSRWGDAFPVEINIGPKTRKMLDAVISMPNFQRAIAAEQEHSTT